MKKSTSLWLYLQFLIKWRSTWSQFPFSLYFSAKLHNYGIEVMSFLQHIFIWNNCTAYITWRRLNLKKRSDFTLLLPGGLSTCSIEKLFLWTEKRGLYCPLFKWSGVGVFSMNKTEDRRKMFITIGKKQQDDFATSNAPSLGWDFFVTTGSVARLAFYGPYILFSENNPGLA